MSRVAFAITSVLGLVVGFGCSEESPQGAPYPVPPKVEATDEATLSPADFSKVYSSELLKSHPTFKIEKKGELTLHVSAGGDLSVICHLENAYSEYLKSKDELDSILEDYIAPVAKGLQEETDEDLDPTRIVPLIKDAGYPKEILEGMKEKGSDVADLEFYVERVNDKLVVMYAEDTGQGLSYLQTQDVKALDLTTQSIRDLAVNNLSRKLGEIRKYSKDGIHVVTAGGTFEASLLLLPSLWRDGSFSVTGQYVVAVPARDVLLVTGSEDSKGIEELRARAQKEVSESAYRLTNSLFVRSGDTWEVFK